MCLLCTATSDNEERARRARVLQLLALVEHPDALPAETSLRLAYEIWALTQAEWPERQCVPVAPSGSATAEAR